MKIILGGALGRMGKEVILAAEKSGDEIVCGVDALCTGNEAIPTVADYALVVRTADVIIDFSRPSALPSLLALAVSRKIPAVLCATGYTPEDLEAIRKASGEIPVLRSGNMSLGVNVMLELCENAARALKSFDAEIIEKHHRMKADAPSGTALMLLDAVREGFGRDMKTVSGREGIIGQRTDDEIGMLSVRGGTVVGEHEVGFYGSGEQVIITHRAENRSLFSQGAITAGKWLQGKAPGLYSMRDVVREMIG